MGFPLRDYQENSVANTLKSWESWRKILGIAPTGAGKTRIFSAIAADRVRRNIQTCIIAHREELIQQAQQKLARDEGIFAQVEKADLRAAPNSPVVIASVQTLLGERRKRFDFGTIIVDECHHILADSYQQVLSEWPRARVLGVTATADRADKKNLGDYFEDIAFEISLVELIERGYLSPITCQTVPLKIDLRGVRKTAGDFNAADLDDALDPILEQAADAIIEHASDRKTLVFLPLIDTARRFAMICSEKGLPANFVSGECADRADKLKAFSNNEFRLLANSMLLTEGYDEPSIDCVVCLRPTQSRGLYSQIIGRGTRLSPGKKNLLILDFLWLLEKHALVKAASLIAGTKEEADRMTRIIEATGGKQLDLQAIRKQADEELLEEKRATHERELSLKRQLEKQAQKKKKLVDPVSFGLDLGEQSLVDYEPSMQWEYQPVSPAQKSTLERFGIDIDSVKGKGHASKLLDTIFTRQRLGLATPKQVSWLIKLGHKSPHTATIKEASAFMDAEFTAKKAA
jgi:superfamily II DNA or RNA helicase